MDPPLIHEASFTAANPSSYSLSEIWPFQVVNGVFGERDGSVEESTVTEQSGGGGRGSGRKRRDLSLEDEESKMVSATSNGNELVYEESKMVSATSNGNELSNLNVKRVKTSGSRNEDGSSQVEVNASSGTSGKLVDQSSKPEPPKDYIHVRARRGQATDSHSLAERARREKISERMKLLQDLVPGCNKVIGKALVLDEIINYIQSLQRQVEFLSMKLEAVNSTMNVSPMIEGFNSKDLCPQPFDVTAMMFGTQATRDYIQGAEPNWLHMQHGATYGRPA